MQKSTEHDHTFSVEKASEILCCIEKFKSKLNNSQKNQKINRANHLSGEEKHAVLIRS